jgi:hypothetical protein|tara:strand:+ start:212 stop:439 length:228 start_codon:yes stop_codon:yes gene_type:complete
MRIISSASNCHDFCNDCAPDPITAEEEYGNVGDGPDDRGNCYGYDETERPTYDDDPDHQYNCEECDIVLTEENAG